MEVDTIFLSLSILLSLSLLTIEACRYHKAFHLKDDNHYLFRASKPSHSLASNAGSAFSVTFLFGGMLLLGSYFGLWLVLPITIAFMTSLFIYRRLFKRMSPEDEEASLVDGRANLLFSVVNQGLSQEQTASLARMYQLTYFLVLAAELAIGRILLTSLFPSNELIGNAFLAILCLVVATYLYVGGFKAVLISDLVQSLVLCSFFLALLAKTTEAATSHQPHKVDIGSPFFTLGLAGICLIALAWSSCGVDYTSRLNYEESSQSSTLRKKDRWRFMRDSLILIGLMLGAGVFVGSRNSQLVRKTTDPVDFFGAVAPAFMSESSALIGITFLVGVFCMLFTTIDSQLLAILQASSYLRRRRSPRKEIFKSLVLAMILAIVVPTNLLYIASMAAVSAMVYPLLAVIPVLFEQSNSWKLDPRDGVYVLVGSVILIPWLYHETDLPSIAAFSMPVVFLALGTISAVVMHRIRVKSS